MRDPLSNTVKEIKPSGIRKFFDVVSEMKDAISLGVGEPDFDKTEISCASLLYSFLLLNHILHHHQQKIYSCL